LDAQQLAKTIADAVTAALKPSTDPPADDLVDDDVDDITGLGLGNQYSLKSPKFDSIAVPLGSRIPAKTRAKIFANEFVDFGALLDPSPTVDKYAISFISPGPSSSTQPKLTLEPTHTPQKIVSIDQWLTAFHTFVAIYSEKNPKETHALMKYVETVRDIASRGEEWSYYDEQFRFLRQSDTKSYPWDAVHWELWHRVVTFQARNNSFRPDKSGARFRNKTPLPRGTCWAFNSGKHCSGCKYEHTCHKCGGNHSGAQCNSATPNLREGVPSSGRKQQTSNPR